MKKKLHCMMLLFLSGITYAQVGIGTTTPATTLEVVGSPANITKADGFMTPRLTRAQLTNKAAAYTATQTGTLVYITDVSGGDALLSRVNVTAIGYYFFDGATWQVAAKTSGDWSLTGNAGTAPGTNFLGTTDAQDFRIRTNNSERVSVTAAGNVGIGTTAPSSTLHVVGTGNITGNTTVGGTLGVTGATTLTGATQINNTLGVTGATAVNNTLAVTGATTLNTSTGGTTTFGNAVGEDRIAIDPVAFGVAAFTGTITSTDLTAARTWTFPDATGTILLNSTLPNTLYTGDGTLAGTRTVTMNTNTLNFLSTAITENPVSVTANSLTTGNGLSVSATALTTGKAVTITTGGAATTGDALSITTGALGASASALDISSANGTTNTNGVVNIVNTAATGAGTFATLRANSTAGSGLTILNNGNIGIGTNAPTETLDVRGNVSNRGLYTINSSDGNAAGSISTTNEAGPNNGVKITASRGSSKIVFETNNAVTTEERMRLSAAGNLGIGTTSPDDTLDVVGGIQVTGTYKDTSGDVGASGDLLNSTLTGTNWVTPSASNTPNIYTADGTLAGTRTVTMNTNTLNFLSTATTQNPVSVTANSLTTGNGLSVNATALTTGKAVAITTGNASTTGDALSIITGALGASASALDISSANGTTNTNGVVNIVNTAATGAGTFATLRANSTAGSGLTILNNGNIGIGTTTPNGTLQFANTLANRKVVLFELANNDHQYYGFGIRGLILRYQVDGTSSNHVFYAGVNATTSNELMRIQGNGNVGIGNTAPSFDLHVGNTGTNGLTSGEGSIGISGSNNTFNHRTWNFAVGGIDGTTSYNTHRLRFIDNGAEKMTIDENGNLGIGTTAPTTTLHVVGTGNITGNTTVGATLGVTGATTLSGATAVNNTLAVTGTTTLNTTTGGATTFGNATGEDRIAIDPVVVGTNPFTGTITSADLTAARTWTFPNATGNVLLDTTAGSTFFVQNGNSFGAAAFLGTNDNNNLNFETNALNRMTITSAGNVGVGTATPASSAALDITSTNQGLLLPRVSTVLAVTSPIDGLMVYDILNKCMRIYEDGAWANCYNGKATNNNIILSSTGKIWMDRNLGATQVATSMTDHLAYGDLYQWGRNADGHQTITWTNSTTGTPVNGSTTTNADVPADALFITENTPPEDWRVNPDDNLWNGVAAVNNPCPAGFRLPTNAEFSAELSAYSITNSATAFSSPFRFTVPGYRTNNSGTLFDVGGSGYYWSSSVNGTLARYRYFDSGSTYVDSDYRAYARTVRCILD